jgi:hypothetical protein
MDEGFARIVVEVVAVRNGVSFEQKKPGSVTLLRTAATPRAASFDPGLCLTYVRPESAT